MTHATGYPTDFYLVSQDLANPYPRRCEVLNRVRGTSRPEAEYVHVTLVPGIPGRTDRAFLFLAGDAKLNDVGVRDVSVDIMICPTYTSGSLNETACTKLGCGGLFRTLEMAIRACPIEYS